MVTAKKCAALILIGCAAWRLVACSANTGPQLGAGGYGGSGAGGPFPPGAGATPGAGGGMQSAGTGPIISQGSGGSIINLGTAGNAGNSNLRDVDSSCHPIKETPEKIIITDSSIVTDTIVTLTPVAIFVMQDRSSSMVEQMPGANGTSWVNSTNAMSAFTKDPLSSGLDVGMGVFPPMSNTTGDCSAGSDCGMPVVPISSLPGNAAAINNAYQMATPPGFPPLLTPTECALRGMINTCLQFMSSSPTGEKCVAVLITDGAPTTCDTTQADLNSIIADGLTKGVETFVLGLPGADMQVLDGFAAAGGSMKSVDVSAGADAFVQALNAIRGKVSHQDKKTVQTMHVIETPLPCEWKIPPQDPNQPPLDPTKVNVVFTPPGQAGQTLGHVPCTGQCTATMPPATCPAMASAGGAWYYDNEMTPTQVFLCPSTCDAIKNVMDATVDLQFHCPQKPFVVM